MLYRPHLKQTPLIIIDAGHSGLSRSGYYLNFPNKRAIQKDGSQINEGVLNRAVAYNLSFLLDRFSIRNIVLTDHTYSDSLRSRVEVANKIIQDYKLNYDLPSLYISIHHNYFNDKSVKGFEVFTNKSKSEAQGVISKAADRIAQLAGEMFEKYQDRRIRFNTESNNLYFRKRPFYVLKHTACPAILTEYGFMSNPAEAKYIASGKGIKQQTWWHYEYIDTAIERQLIDM